MRAVAILFIVLLGTAQADPLPAPELPTLVAENMYQCGSMEVAIYASGFAHFNRVDFCGSVPNEINLRRISPETLATIDRAIEGSAFESLPPNIRSPLVSTDESLYLITLNRPGHTCKVDITDPERLSENKLARRFMEVWAAIEKAVPELAE